MTDPNSADSDPRDGESLDDGNIHDPEGPNTEAGASLGGVSGDFLKPSPVPPELRVGDSIGPYQILEELGQGGFGVVYRAERSDTQRSVALKVIIEGMHTKEVLARFDAEKNALALLNHPNVAKVFDSGRTTGGKPYFVMEYVPGDPVTVYCTNNRVSLSERLELFQKICEGVQHAHSKAVVHRDLTPRNVLVASVDGKPVVKIIDFGLAKALGPRLTEMTLDSLKHQVMGTPAYMSPEQAAGDEDIDVRTDVYSLGAILYELLVDGQPFDREKKPLDEQLRMVREEDPSPPSLRLSRLGKEQAKKLAESRGLDSGRLRARLRGELDWIVLMALRKARGERYESPRALSDDIDRHLVGHEPVIARPPSAIYKLKKFSRKYRASLTTVTLVFIALIAGTIWALSERTRADRKAEEAVAARQELLGLADTKRLVDARAELDSLWPLEPAQRERLRRWLDERARPLAERLTSEHEVALAVLRAQARGRTEEEIQSDRARHEDAPKLEQARSTLAEVEQKLAGLVMTSAALEDPDTAESAEALAEKRKAFETQRAELAQQIADLEVTVRERQTYMFVTSSGEPDEELQWQHDTREELVESLRGFVETDRYGDSIASAEWRLEEIDRLEQASIGSDEAKRRWKACLADIRADERVYAGLELQEQFGLLPLERNARTGLWEFVHLPTGDEPKENPDWKATSEEQTEAKHFSRWAIDETTGVILVLVPAGSFMMGAEPPSLGVILEKGSLRVTAVREASLAANAGLRVDDEVRTIHGIPVSTVEEIKASLTMLTSGATIEIAVTRDEVELALAGVLARSSYDPGARPNERPILEVTLDAYLVSKYELTQAQWKHMTGSNPSDYGPTFSIAHHQNTAWNPVESVSWSECTKWLPRYGLELPTEAQWERAARGGTTTPWWCGQAKASIGERQAGNLADDRSRTSRGVPSSWPFEAWTDAWILHAPVGRFRSNAYGLHDTIGNLWEWCADGFTSYSSDPRSGDGLRDDPDSRFRVYRGGSFYYDASDARSALRFSLAPEVMGDFLSVRPARRIL